MIAISDMSLSTLMTVFIYLAGLVLKESQLKNRWIPIILPILGAVLMVCLKRPKPTLITRTAMEGFICAAIATYGNEAIKQLSKFNILNKK